MSDSSNNNLRRIDFQTRTVGTLAGSTERTWGLVDGLTYEARYNVPKGLSIASSGDLWVADSQNHCVRVLRAEPGAAPTPRARPMELPSPAAAWTDPLGGDDRRGVGPLAKAAAERRASAIGSGGGFRSGPARAAPETPAPGGGGSGGGGGGSVASTPRRLDPAAAAAAALSVPAAYDDALPPADDFAYDDVPPPTEVSNAALAGGFQAEAQLFERAMPSRNARQRGERSRGGWTYTGAAQVTLRTTHHPCRRLPSAAAADDGR